MRSFCAGIKKDRLNNVTEQNGNDDDREIDVEKETEIENNGKEFGPVNITELVKQWTENDINEYVEISDRIENTNRDEIAKMMITCFGGIEIDSDEKEF